MINKLNDYGKRRNKLLRELQISRESQEYLVNNNLEKYKNKTLAQWKQQESNLINRYDNIKPTNTTLYLSIIFLIFLSLGLFINLQPNITGLAITDIFQNPVLELQPTTLTQGEIVTISITPETSVFRQIYIYNLNNVLQDRITICNTIECTIDSDVMYNTSILSIGDYYITLFDYSTLDWISKDFTIVEELEPGAAEIISDELIQGQAIINIPVEWTRNIMLKQETAGLTVDIPHQAFDLRIREIILGIIGKEIRDFSFQEGKITINETIKNIQIKYFTPAPIIIDEIQITPYKKRITVASEIHYENILTSTSIIETTKERIKLYRLINGRRELVSNITYKKPILGWIIPFLSNQTYEIEIIQPSLSTNQTYEIEISPPITLAEPSSAVTDLKSPTQTGSPLNQWTDGSNIDINSVSDNQYATETTIGDALDTSNYSFGVPNGSIINGIHVQVEGRNSLNSCILGDATLAVDLSFDGGTTYTTQKTKIFCAEATESYGSLIDTWGYTWTVDELSNASFRARINYSACNIEGCSKFNPGIDHIQIQVNYTLVNIPYTILNSPENETNFLLDSYNIILNSTVIDNDDDPIDVLIYGVNSTDTANFYNYLLFKELDVSNGTQVTYNFTILPVNPNSQGLVGLWHFDNLSEFGENDTYSVDFSGNNNNGTWFGNPVYNTIGAKFGYGVEFGIGKFIEINDDISLEPDNFTVSLWVNFDIINDMIVLTKDDDSADYSPEYGYHIRSDAPSNTIWMQIGTGTSDFDGTHMDITTNRWYHIAFTYNWSGTTSSLESYIDGDSQGITTNSNRINYTNSDNLFISSDTIIDFDGTIDDVAIWNRSLSAGEIKNLNKLKADKYFWKVNVTDSIGRNNESETREFKIGLNPPYAILNLPPPNGTIELNIEEVILNITVNDVDLDPIKTLIYGVNSSSTNDFYTTGFLFSHPGLASGTTFTFNWSGTLAVPDESTVLLFHFDNDSFFGENDSFVYDFSNNENHGTIESRGKINITGGKFGGGFEVDGIPPAPTIQILKVGNVLQQNEPDGFSGAAWFTTKSNSQTRAKVWSKGIGEVFELEADVNSDSLKCKVVDQGGSPHNTSASNIHLELDTFYHAVCTFNHTSKNLSLYINGEFNTSVNVPTFAQFSSSHTGLYIGCRQGGCSGNTWNGTIDEVIIWSRTLSPDEVQEIYNLREGKWFNYSSPLKSGEYFWKVNVTDPFGNNNESETRNFTIKDTLVPSITNPDASPNPQGYGLDVVISADITDVNGVDTVLVGIIPPGDVETNYTMNNVGSFYSYGFFSWTNGTHDYTIYANDTSGNLDSVSGTFDILINLTIQVRTIRDAYGPNRIVNLTDPPESMLNITDKSDNKEDDSLISAKGKYFSSLYSKTIGLSSGGLRTITGFVFHSPLVEGTNLISSPDAFVLMDPDDVANDIFGVSAVGDFNNDGFADALISAQEADGGNPDTGKAYIYYGPITNLASPNVTLLDPDDVTGDKFGIELSLGDFNNDGFADALISAQEADGGNLDTGKAYIYYGPITNLASPNVTLLDPDDVANDIFGVSAVGDFNNDGFADALISAQKADGGNPNTGKAYIYYGPIADLASPDVTLLDPDDVTGDFFGFVSSGDFNNDNFDDALIGAIGAGGVFVGKAYIYYGPITNLASPDVTLLDPDGVASDLFGIVGGRSGDFNNDGFDDALIGAQDADGGNPNTGKAYIYYGPIADLASPNVTLLDPDDVTDDRFGSKTSLGDFNNDGFDDALISARAADGGNPSTGKAYIYYGPIANLASPDFTLLDPDDVVNDQFGSISSGDFNNDGFADALIGAQFADGGNADTGKAYIYFFGNTFYKYYPSTVPEGTTSTTVNVLTYLDSECRYSFVSDTPFASMAIMSTTDSLDHSFSITSMEDGTTYVTYARCNNLIQSYISEQMNLSVAVGGVPPGDPPIASFGTNPVDGYNSPASGVSFELSCTEGTAPLDTLQLWGDWYGWQAVATNTNPTSGGIWNVTVGVPQGTWKWGVYCSDTSGLSDWTDTNRTITAPLAIVYSEFQEKGNTTDLSFVGDNDTIVSDLILDDGEDGSIHFLQDVTLNKSYNLDLAIEIGSDFVFVDSELYPSLNVTANVTKLNLELGYPIILKDGQTCADCTTLFWDTDIGKLIFETSSFSTFTFAERDQSKIQNNGTTNTSLYLFMRIDKSVGGIWEHLDIIYNENTIFVVNNTPEQGNILKLDTYFNDKWDTTENGTGDGEYRVYVAAIDDIGNVLMNHDGRFVNATYNFTISTIPPQITTINITDDISSQINEITPFAGNRSRVNITVEVIDTIGFCEDSIVKAYLCKPDDYNSCSNTQFTRDYQIELNTSNSGTASCEFKYSFNTHGQANTSWFFEPPGDKNVNPWKIFVTATNQGGTINSSEDFTYNAIQAESYNYDPLFLGAPEGGSINALQWNTNTQNRYNFTNIGNTNFFVEWNITNPTCSDPASSCDSAIWTIAGDDFMIDDDQNQADDTNTLDAVFLNGTPKAFPDQSNPISPCTDPLCQSDGFITTYYHLKPPTLPVGTYNTTITYTVRPITPITPIFYIPPTPDDGSTVSDSIYINVSTTIPNEIYGFTNLDNSLYAWYRLDNDSSVSENDTHVYDWSEKGHNGTISGTGNDAKPTTSGKFAGGYEFDPSRDDYITIGTGSNFSDICTKGCTFSAWANRANAFGYTIIGRDDLDGDNQFFRLYVGGGTGDKLGFLITEDGTTTNRCLPPETGLIPSNEWHNLVGIFNTTHIILYLDGSEVINWYCGVGFAINEAAWQDPESTFIGTHDDSFLGEGLGWIGTIDEVLIFNRSLSSQEIQILYNATSPRFQNNYTNLNPGLHTFQSFAVNTEGTMAKTELREVTLT